MSTFSEEIEKYFKVTDDKICGFFKEYRFLSNYHGCAVRYNDCLYTSTEAAFQAAKSINPDDHKRFQNLSAAESKIEGRKLTLREDWESVKEQVMLDITFEKYKNLELKQLLLATDPKDLEETNHWGDTYWGVDYETGEGKNMLGKILMIVRAVLKAKTT